MSTYKIIKGLECCSTRSCYDAGCPYHDKSPNYGIDDCTSNLAADALDLIRELQEEIAVAPARVMGLEELRSLPVGAVVWMEYRYTDRLDSPGWHYDPVTPMMVNMDPLQGSGDRVLVNQECITELSDALLDLSQPDETGDACQERYWTRQPTEAQRRGTPWKE